MARSAEERNQWLIGMSCGDLTILRFTTRSGSLKKEPRVIVRCKCGREYPVYMAKLRENIKKGHPVMCYHTQDNTKPTEEDRFKEKPKNTICEHCKRATNRFLCCWAGGKPRKDWTATETYVHDTMGHGYQSYRVLKCPGFERG